MTYIHLAFVIYLCNFLSCAINFNIKNFTKSNNAGYRPFNSQFGPAIPHLGIGSNVALIKMLQLKQFERIISLLSFMHKLLPTIIASIGLIMCNRDNIHTLFLI